MRGRAAALLLAGERSTSVVYDGAYILRSGAGVSIEGDPSSAELDLTPLLIHRQPHHVADWRWPLLGRAEAEVVE